MQITTATHLSDNTTTTWSVAPTPLRPTPEPAPNAVAQARTTFFRNFDLQRLLDVTTGDVLRSGLASAEDAARAAASLGLPAVGVIARGDVFDAVELLVANLTEGLQFPGDDGFWKDVSPIRLRLGEDRVLSRSIEALRLLPGSNLVGVTVGGTLHTDFETA